jgi:hypothetical protein
MSAASKACQQLVKHAKARFNGPKSAAVPANGGVCVSDIGHHARRVRRSQGGVGTLCGSREAGDGDAEGADARLSTPCGLALHAEGKLLVAGQIGARTR